MGFFKKRSVDDLGEKKKDMPEGLWTTLRAKAPPHEFEGHGAGEGGAGTDAAGEQQ